MQTYLYTSLNESAVARNEKECLSGIIKLEVSLSPYNERTRGGGVLIKEDKRMFWVMIRKSIKETKTVFFSSSSSSLLFD
jgi:hypothetical protein